MDTDELSDLVLEQLQLAGHRFDYDTINLILHTAKRN